MQVESLPFLFPRPSVATSVGLQPPNIRGCVLVANNKSFRSVTCRGFACDRCIYTGVKKKEREGAHSYVRSTEITAGKKKKMLGEVRLFARSFAPLRTVRIFMLYQLPAARQKNFIAQKTCV